MKIDYPSDADLRAMIRFDSESGCIWLGQQRMILTHATAFGSMRSELIDSFGEEYARGVLMRMGYNAAQYDAQLAHSTRPDSMMDAFLVGPQLHSIEGIVGVEPLSVEIDPDTHHFYGEFSWSNSFEAAEHLRLYGVSDKPCCWNLLGYATGYTSAFMGKPIYFKEVECVAKGDSRCRIIGKPAEEWDEVEEFEKILSLQSMACKVNSLEEEVKFLRHEIIAAGDPDKIIAESVSIREVLFLLEKAAKTNVTVLMLGETGVGKEVFSQALHQMGELAPGPFIAVNCAALPQELIEAELFGVEKGGFSGAHQSRPGRFERADGGTLFLDELGELTEPAQAKLLRAIQTGEFERVGGSKKIKVDVRLIAATNADLAQRVKQGTFRADLYYRLNVFPISIPPLRDRLTDIPGLVKKFITVYNAKYAKQVLGITDETLNRFLAYEWPGNIRELENIIKRGVILTDDNHRIESQHVRIGMPNELDCKMSLNAAGNLSKGQPPSQTNLLDSMETGKLSLEQLEAEVLQQAYSRTNQCVAETARLTGLSAPQCRYRLKKFGLLS